VGHKANICIHHILHNRRGIQVVTAGATTTTINKNYSEIKGMTMIKIIASITLMLLVAPVGYAGSLNWYRVNCIESSDKLGMCNAAVSSTISGIVSGYAVANKPPFFCEKKYFSTELLHTATRFKPYAKKLTEDLYTIKQQKSLKLSDVMVEYLKLDLPLEGCYLTD